MSYGRGFEGSRLAMTKGMSRAEIAKLYRQDLKAAIARGDLPKGLKVSVRTQEYSGGGSINVRVTAVPEGFKLLNPSRMYAELCAPHAHQDRPFQSAQAAALLKKLDALLQAYNFDDSDTQTDYFHVRFYGSASFDHELESAERAAYKASFEAGTLADPGEQSYLDYREEVERLSELKPDPANEQAVQAAAAAKALGAGKAPRITKAEVAELAIDPTKPTKVVCTYMAPGHLIAPNVSTTFKLAPTEQVSEYEAALVAAGFI